MPGRVISDAPSVPDGEYLVRYLGYETTKSWNRPKAVLHFAIVKGHYEGVPLSRNYNVDALDGAQGDTGGFIATGRQSIVREFRRLLQAAASSGAVDPEQYRGRLIRARVEKVTKDGLGKPIDPANQYSVIRELLEIANEADVAV